MKRLLTVATAVAAVVLSGCGQSQSKGTMLDSVAHAVTHAQQGPTMLDTVANAVKPLSHR